MLGPHLGLDLSKLIYPDPGREEESSRLLKETWLTQPALFSVEYSLACLWMEWGVRASAMIGHSIGEYVAACLAGVFTLEDALALVATRGRLMQQCAEGSMLAVPLGHRELQPMLGAELSLAAINAPSACVVSGPSEAVAELRTHLAETGIESSPLHTSHAFHSQLMDPILSTFVQQLRRVRLSPPNLPFVSNVTGTWISDGEATSPEYWARHMRQTVLFADGLRELLRDDDTVLLEIGPGKTLCGFARRQCAPETNHVVLNSLRHPHDPQSDVALLLNTVGRLWLAGVKLDWAKFNEGRPGTRVSLPTYPFERQRFWIELRPMAALSTQAGSLRKHEDVADWFYLPAWKQSAWPGLCEKTSREPLPWLVFMDECGIGEEIVKQLKQQGQQITTVLKGDAFERVSDDTYTLNSQCGEQYASLFRELQHRDSLPSVVIYLWGVTQAGFCDDVNPEGFDSLINLSRTLGEHHAGDSARLVVVSNHTQEVTGTERLQPEKALLLGLCHVVPQEYPNLECRTIDILLADVNGTKRRRLAADLIAEVSAATAEPVVTYRGRQRWVQIFEPLKLDEPTRDDRLLRQGGVYIITGGLGHIGTLLATHLARIVSAKLTLVARKPLPARDEWDELLARDDGSEVARRVRAVRSIEDAGGKVLTVCADVTDEQQMGEAIEQTLRCYGRLDGVFHAAVGESLRAIQEMDQVARDAHFSAKVRGVLILEKVLRGRRLDFCLLMSSLSSVLGGLGYAAYAAANSFLDCFAHAQSRRSAFPWISVNWDGWKFTDEQRNSPALGATQAELNITPREGMAVFERVLRRDVPPQMIVSTGDLQTRLCQWVNRNVTRPEGSDTPTTLYQRPEVSNDFVAPGNAVEESIAEIWQNLLGIKSIGVEDNFFDLGGDSLLATQAIARLRTAFQISLPLRAFFESPTIRSLAVIIEEILTVEIESLSEEETRQLLERES